MITRGSNTPIVFKPKNAPTAALAKLTAILTLSGVILKQWALEDVSYVEESYHLPLTEAETLAFKPGMATLEIKFLVGDNNIYFTENKVIQIKNTDNDEPFGVAVAGNQEVEPIAIEVTTNTVYVGGGGGGGAVNTVNNKQPDITGNVSLYANDIDFADGQNFQEKFDSGQLNGADGKSATINGVTTLTMVEGANITLSQQGSNLNIGTTGLATNEALEQVKQVADSAVQTETDPTVPAWAKQASKPTYTAQEVGALPASTEIPTELPNPYALTFTGAVTGTYDGSKVVTVNIPSSSTGGTTVTVGGNPVETFNADTKQNSLTVEQINNIAEIPTIKETADNAITQATGDERYEPKNAVSVHNSNADAHTNLARKAEIPTKLPNPNVLTFTGAVTDTYDGSAPKSIAIPNVGDDGATFTPIPTVTGNTLNLAWENDKGKTNPTPVDLVAPQGNDGVGVASIVKTSTVGLVDTYTITFTNATTTTFDVTNGASVAVLDKTQAEYDALSEAEKLNGTLYVIVEG